MFTVYTTHRHFSNKVCLIKHLMSDTTVPCILVFSTTMIKQTLTSPVSAGNV